MGEFAGGYFLQFCGLLLEDSFAGGVVCGFDVPAGAELVQVVVKFRRGGGVDAGEVSAEVVVLKVCEAGPAAFCLVVPNDVIMRLSESLPEGQGERVEKLVFPVVVVDGRHTNLHQGSELQYPTCQG